MNQPNVSITPSQRRPYEFRFHHFLRGLRALFEHRAALSAAEGAALTRLVEGLPRDALWALATAGVPFASPAARAALIAAGVSG